MFQLFEKFDWATAWAINVAIQSIRYLLFAGLAYALFYVLLKNRLAGLRIQQKFPSLGNISTEIKYSLLTQCVFGLVIFGVFLMYKQGWTQIYTDFSEYGGWYFAGSVVFLLVVHDTYFYWAHRLMHHPKLYKHVHRVHHLSHNPSPWAAFSFHPLEAFIEAAIVPVLVIMLPLHPLALFIFTTASLIMNILGHLGYEIFPKRYIKNWFGKWQNTSTHHNMHHELVKCNYGLYFNLWDKLMGTNHPDYEKRFEQNAGGMETVAGKELRTKVKDNDKVLI